MGYPLVEVRCENNTVKAKQGRFLLNPMDNETGVDQIPSPFKYKWYVPLTYVTDTNPRTMQLAWMNMSDTCKEAAKHTHQWIIHLPVKHFIPEYSLN